MLILTSHATAMLDSSSQGFSDQESKLICSVCNTIGSPPCACGEPCYSVIKVEAAKEAIKANPDMNNQAIAAKVGCGEWTVRYARKQFRGDHETERRTGKDGKSYPTTKKRRTERPVVGPQIERARAIIRPLVEAGQQRVARCSDEWTVRYARKQFSGESRN